MAFSDAHSLMIVWWVLDIKIDIKHVNDITIGFKLLIF